MRALVTVAAGPLSRCYRVHRHRPRRRVRLRVRRRRRGKPLPVHAHPAERERLGRDGIRRARLHAVSNRDDYVVFRSDGAQLTAVLNLTDAVGPGTPSSVVINDAGVIA